MINPKIKDYLNSTETYNQQIGIILAIGKGVCINEIVDYFIHHSKCWILRLEQMDYWYESNILDLSIDIGIEHDGDVFIPYVNIEPKIWYGLNYSNGEYYDERNNYLHSTLFRHINISVREFISSI